MCSFALTVSRLNFLGRFLDRRARSPRSFYKAITRVPAAIKPQPIADFTENCSWRNITAKIIVMTTLSLSIGTTLEACPICRAL